MKITAKDILKPALILFVICLVVTALLAGTNLLTKDKIAEQSVTSVTEIAKQIEKPSEIRIRKVAVHKVVPFLFFHQVPFFINNSLTESISIK